EALLEPSDPAGFSYLERYAVAAFTAGLLGAPAAEEFYRDLLRDEDESASWAIAELLDEAVTTSVPDTGTGVPGPYGTFDSAALAEENAPGPWFTAAAEPATPLDDKLVAGLEFAHLLVLHPRDSRPGHLALLLEAGWDEDGIVTLAQLVSFLNFQIRISTGLAALAHTPDAPAEAAAAGPGPDSEPAAEPADPATGVDSPASARVEEALAAVGDRVSTNPDLNRPEVFQQ